MLMRWILALHIISVVCWFAGLFYLPRLYVYHTQAEDKISIERFKIMEWRLYYAITTPAAVATIISGMWLLGFNLAAYHSAGWMHIKLLLVLILIIYHIFCGIMLNAFKHDNNIHSEKFYRIFNEVPTLLLIAIVILVVVQP